MHKNNTFPLKQLSRIIIGWSWVPVLIFFFIWLGTADVSASHPDNVSDARKPNIILIVADDLGWGDLGVYGHDEIRTPNLDRLAMQGTLFTQFYVNSVVCSPSRAAFFTGRYPARLRIHAHIQKSPEENTARGMAQWLDPKIPNVASMLKSIGYATAHIGKWHLGPLPGSPGVKDPAHPQIRDYGFDFIGSSATLEQRTARDPNYRAKSTAILVDEALQFIAKNKNRSFYVQLWPILPHAPLNPTREQMKPFEMFSPPNAPYRGAKTIYYASVADLDSQIGRLVNQLDAMGLKQNTMVIFSSDNGPEDIHVPNASHSAIGSAGPFRGKKRSLYEGGIRLPFIVRWPGVVPQGRVDNESVIAGVDFLPTVAAFVGATIPEAQALDGENRSDVLRGRSGPRARPLFWEWRFNHFGDAVHLSPMLAIRDGDWKLLMNPDRSRVELYDLRNDSSELENLAKLRPEIADRLSKKLLEWQATLPPGPVYPGAGRIQYRWPGMPH